ncbi:hypothetical protein FN846DRAFT_891859 [Sphaerosporella brunnea]|uniref:Uncharacterized protein n=1 Tax=Sphaerosporella brunnea TaxID=1250544 RepID=A0A5J5ET14_9PEZI|nr:hypothetical protein FN846DRAFT_891859 [Sphaerosporella brunnea]
MPVIASNTRPTRAGCPPQSAGSFIEMNRVGKVIKAPPAKTLTRKPKKVASDDEYEPQPVADGEGEVEVPESQTFTALEQKIKDLKKKTASKNYAETFSSKAKAREETLFKSLKQRQQTMTKSSEKASMEIVALIQEAIEDENPLGDFHASLISMMNELTDKHKPLQAAIQSALSNDLIVGENWRQDGEDAIEQISLYSSKAMEAIYELMEGAEDGHSEDDDSDGPWAKRVKISEKGVSKALSMVPIPDKLSGDWHDFGGMGRRSPKVQLG